MKERIRISVFEVVGSPLCVASGDGQKVYKRLAAILKEESNVTLSFRNVKMLTSAFLNAAIGQLYGNFSEEKICELLKVEDTKQDDLVLLGRVVDTAKKYFENPKRFTAAVRKEREKD